MQLTRTSAPSGLEQAYVQRKLIDFSRDKRTFLLLALIGEAIVCRSALHRTGAVGMSPSFSRLIGSRLIGAALVALAIPAGAAHAQYAMAVYGKGPALDCYEMVKAKRLGATTYDLCTAALKDDSLSPKNRAATFNNRGIVQMRQGNRAAAERDYEAALRISPNIAETQINLGAMFYANAMYTESVTVLNEGVKAENADSRAIAHYNRALSLEKLGEFDEAYADLRAAVNLNPTFEAASKQLTRYSVVQDRNS
jgi:tetratricopeptide (TPR) repeat protein